MVPDIVEIKRLCSSGQWHTRIENEKILLHDTVAGETVCIGQTDAEPVRHGFWNWNLGFPYCSECKNIAHKKGFAGYHTSSYCHNCGAKMDGGKQNEHAKED